MTTRSFKTWTKGGARARRAFPLRTYKKRQILKYYYIKAENWSLIGGVAVQEMWLCALGKRPPAHPVHRQLAPALLVEARLF